MAQGKPGTGQPRKRRTGDRAHDRTTRRVARARDETPDDLVRECPRCHATPGNRCTAPSGRNTPTHSQRRTTTPPRGRPPLLATNPEITQPILDALANGTPINIAAASVGIPPATIYRWLTQGESDHPDDECYRRFREEATQARARGLSWHVANVTKVARGGYMKKHVVRTLRDGTIEEEKEWALPDWRASAFLLERQAPAEFGKRQTLEIGPADSVEPRVAAGGGPGDVGGALAQEGIDRLATNLAALRGAIEAGQHHTVEASSTEEPIDAEVVEEEAG